MGYVLRTKTPNSFSSWNASLRASLISPTYPPHWHRTLRNAEASPDENKGWNGQVSSRNLTTWVTPDTLW